MKKKYLYCILIVFSCLMVFYPIITKADSGWDSDYDTGGSWSSGSDWSSSGWDYGHHSSSYSSYLPNSPIVTVIFFIIIFVLAIIYTIKLIQKNKGIPPIEDPALENLHPINGNNNYIDIEQSKINEIDPSINIEDFKKKAFNIYKDIQEAWMNFDTDKIRKLTTDEIYNMYSSQLETLKLKNQKNIMKNIEYVDAKITDIASVNDIITINVYLRVKVLDYVINVKTNKTVRGRDNARLDIEYNLTFVKSETDDKKVETCPNCGAPVDIISSATCPYCNSVLVKNASDYVMSKKTCIGQRLDI